jgi:hypothetical protein
VPAIETDPTHVSAGQGIGVISPGSAFGPLRAEANHELVHGRPIAHDAWAGVHGSNELIRQGRENALPNYAIIEAPSVLGHIPFHLGVARMPEFLLGLGLAERLSARRAGRVESPPYQPGRDPDTEIMNPGALQEYSIALADSVEEVLDVGEFPIVLEVTVRFSSAQCWR